MGGFGKGGRFGPSLVVVIVIDVSAVASLLLFLMLLLIHCLMNVVEIDSIGADIVIDTVVHVTSVSSINGSTTTTTPRGSQRFGSTAIRGLFAARDGILFDPIG